MTGTDFRYYNFRVENDNRACDFGILLLEEWIEKVHNTR